MSELQTLQKQLETQLKSNPAKEMAIAEAIKAEPMQPPARMMRRLQEAVAQIPRSESAPGTGKSKTMIEMLNKMMREAQADVIARPDAMRNIEGSIAKAAPMETPYGKSLLSYTPEGKIAGKTGAALRGLGKAASKLAGPVGAVLTAIDLGQALGEVQDKGAAKIAEDYKNSQLAESEDTGDKLMMKMEPMERGLRKNQEYMAELKKEKQYTPEERMKLKEMLSKYRADAALRSAE